MRRIAVMLAAMTMMATTAKAQDNADRIGAGVTGHFRPAASAALFWEHETRYHDAWEVYVTGSVKLDNPGDLSANYKCWGVGAAWKPCLYRAKNRCGSARIGVSLGADPTDFLAGIHAGWQHSYALKRGWQFYWQAGVDVMLPRRDDLFRAGAGLGFKLPVRDRMRRR